MLITASQTWMIISGQHSGVAAPASRLRRHDNGFDNHFRAAVRSAAGQRFSSRSSTSPVSELRHRLSSRQYPGAQHGSNATAEAAAGSALTTSPVELFKQSDPISQYPAGHRGLVGF